VGQFLEFGNVETNANGSQKKPKPRESLGASRY
jgi:hypothetical protein